MTARLRKSALASVLVASAALAVSGCKPHARYPLDTLAPTSDLTKAFYDLFVEVTVLDIIVLIVVVGALFLAILVFSTRTGAAREPSVKHSDMYLEMAWTIIPALILLAITVPTVRTIIRTQPYSWPKDALTVEVIAHQWWWEFHYPTLGVETADEVHIPTGQTIHFAMFSKDVIHSFFMPQVGGKRNVIQGRRTRLPWLPTCRGNTTGNALNSAEIRTQTCGFAFSYKRRPISSNGSNINSNRRPSLLPVLRRRGRRFSPTHRARFAIRLEGSPGFPSNILTGSAGPT